MAVFGTFAVIAQNLSPNPDPVGTVVSTVIFAMPLSYIVGYKPAIAVGIIVGLGQVLYCRFGLAHVAVIGIVCGLVFAFYFDTSPTVGINAQLYMGVKVLICLVPALVCWRIARPKSPIATP